MILISRGKYYTEIPKLNAQIIQENNNKMKILLLDVWKINHQDLQYSRLKVFPI